MNPEIITLIEEVLKDYEEYLHNEIDDWSRGYKADDAQSKKLASEKIKAYRDRFTNLVMESK